jgi:hypothetical protein
MADKTLRIIFNGISTLWPGPSRNGEKRDELQHKAFVMMAANYEKKRHKRGTQTNDWQTTIPKHFPFVHVARSVLVDPPAPNEVVVVCEGGEHNIYFFKDARVVIAPRPKQGTLIDYYIDPEGRPLSERPGSIDDPPAEDIRWLADIRDILSKPALKQTAIPTESNKPNIGEEVAAVVNLDGGQLKANFPCAGVAPKTFKDNKTGKTVPGLQRVLADEFIIDIPYAADINSVTLEFQELREGIPVNFPYSEDSDQDTPELRQLSEGTPVNAPKRLVIGWPAGETLLVLRMGNDTKDEIRRLDTPERCDPVRVSGPVPKPRDDDFDLHYNFLDIPDDAGRPLPQNDIQQCDFNGCKPGTT